MVLKWAIQPFVYTLYTLHIYLLSYRLKCVLYVCFFKTCMYIWISEIKTNKQTNVTFSRKWLRPCHAKRNLHFYISSTRS